jgi:hypothetical protein
MLEIEGTLDRRPLAADAADRMCRFADRLQDAWREQEAGGAR